MTIYGVDFMCGIGGATRGFLDAGIQVVKGIDVDGYCKETYERNNPPAKFVEKKIEEITPEEVMEDISLRTGDYLAFIACAPCQPFSTAGVKDPTDTRTKVILSMNKLIRKIKPDFVFVENVPGFQQLYPAIFKQFLKPYIELHYYYDNDIQNLKYYGIPQNRRRYSFIASKHGPISLPIKTHDSKTGFVTVRKVIQRFPEIVAGETHPTVPNHHCPNITEINLNRLKHTPQNGGGRMDWPDELWLECHKNKPKSFGYEDVYGRLRWDEPGSTITCRCISISNGRFAHPVQNRSISVREAAALQTFRDDFKFYGPLARVAKHIGNAVPPRLAKLFAQEIINAAALNESGYFVKSLRGSHTEESVLQSSYLLNESLRLPL